jgi:hypothetical protein
VSAPSLGWLILSPLLGLLAFWGYILLGGGESKTRRAGLPFCDRHRGYWPRRARFIVFGFLLLIGLGVAGSMLAPPPAPGKEPEANGVVMAFACWMLVFPPAFIIVHLAAMRPTGGGRRTLVLSGACQAFADAIEDEYEPDEPR